ncbi:threonine synthase [Natronococcus amylolyticus DSM 10524]|uniref:Threonine synthase n=1 Tax=Natronococcus amylolyticus DSM 10524 TaxID=1227497 RepID=L9X3M4_9EURY|nr:threonine synthase [Natronococcus amylolyticus]ELY56046.1 threonine synthase [Natronococcus amylolyticus DSM 10524]
MTRQVRCYDCAETYGIDDRKRCTCGEPLWFETDSSSFEWPDEEWTTGMWRYADVLPVTDPVGVPPGTTPLVRAARIDEYAGCRLHVKNEAQNPTGSFKDRGTAVGVGYAVQTDRDWIGTVSHGNMALSTSAYAASAGLECAVFVPADTPVERLELIDRHDPHIFRVEGDYGRLYAETLALETGVWFINSDTPLRVAGQKTVAYEIFEQLHPAEPDALVLPISSGGQASAVWKAVRELESAGLIDDVPRLYFVQAAACDPIATAYRNGESVVTPVVADETIAISIANSDPPSGTRALVAARDTGGTVISVPDNEIRDAMARVATSVGTDVEPSSAVAVAGVRRLSRSGDVGADDDVAAILTGSGYKERYDAEVDSRTIDLDDLEQDLASVVGR